MRTIEELRKEWGKQAISNVEAEAKSRQQRAKSAHESFIELLWYLEKTQRFNENPVYKKSTFEQYLSFEYGLRHTTYKNHLQAYQNYPRLASTYSPHLVSSIKAKCGAAKVLTVAKEIEMAESKTKAPLPKHAIQSIIDRHRRPQPERGAVVDVVELEDKLAQAVAKSLSLEKELDEKSIQVEKLKASVRRLKADNRALRNENARLREELDGFLDNGSELDLRVHGSSQPEVGVS